MGIAAETLGGSSAGVPGRWRVMLLMVLFAVGGTACAQEPTPYPWTPQYKAGGTAADVKGPGGVNFPNWTLCGVQGGIPNVPAFATIESYGGQADDDADDSAALSAACAAAGAAGGGAVVLGEGTYHLDAKVVISANNVVIRGKGLARTHIVIRYSGSEGSKYDGVIKFLGRDALSTHYLAEDGKRGDTVLTLQDVTGLVVGDWLRVYAPPTPRWNEMVGNKCQWLPFRLYMVRIERIEGNAVTINQPLRIEFPVIDQARVYKMDPIRNCGIEGLSIRQAGPQPWIQTVLFQNAVNCWGRQVRVDWTGRNPLYGITVKWMEIRDCEFHDAHNTGGGGTAYVGWESGWDCLMECVSTSNMRHAPCLEWGSSGCVFRDSTFLNSDAQCHSGWCHDNLFENCTVTNPTGYGAYGHGFWSTPPDDVSHGPIGPRNVIYNCDFLDVPRTGLTMSGMNENWIVLYNRFVTNDTGVACRGVSFDHIISGNVFVIRTAAPSAVFIEWASAGGIDVVKNDLYGGSGQIVSGAAQPATLRGNRCFPLPAATPARPKPSPRSIYEWQLKNASGKRTP